MSKVTVTDKLCLQACFLLVKKLEKEYEQNFPNRPATDAFWKRLDEVEAKFMGALGKRPLTKAAINSLGDRAFKALRATMVNVATTVAQPRYREATNVDTGAVRMIQDD